jgi:hypothetical protein
MGAEKLAVIDCETLCRLDTVPPPDGEDDAYGAITKVGPLSTLQIAALMDSSDEPEPVSGVHATAAALPVVERACPPAISVVPVVPAVFAQAPVVDEREKPGEPQQGDGPRVPASLVTTFAVGGFVAILGTIATLAFHFFG